MATTPEGKYKQRTCRLITLCSDNTTFDLKVLSAIIAYAAALIPPPQTTNTNPNTITTTTTTRLTSAQSQSTSSGDTLTTTTTNTNNTNTTVKDGVEGDPMHAVITALQAIFAAPSTGSGHGNSNNSNTIIGSPSGRSGKSMKGSKKSNASAAAAAAATATLSSKLPSGSVVTTETGRSIVAGGLLRQPCDWYSVLQSPQWEVPLVFIHKLPDVESGDDETASVAASSYRATSPDFCTTLQRALQIITEDIETTTTGIGNQNGSNSNSGSVNSPANTMTNTDCIMVNKEGNPAIIGSEVSGTTIPSVAQTVEEVTPLTSSEKVKGGKYKDIAVVLALQDPRLLAILMNNRKTLVANHVDMRLIVNFVDGHFSQGVSASPNYSAGSSSIVQRPRAGSGNAKRLNTRENTITTPTPPVKEGDRGTATSPNVNTFELWIDRYQREGHITIMTSSSSALHASNVLCLREALDGESEDRKMWIRRCVQEVIPTIQYMTRDMTQYTDWISSKVIYEYPITVVSSQQQNEDISMYNDTTIFASPTEQQQQQRSRTNVFNSIATSVLDRDAMRSTIKETSLSPQFVEQTRPYKEDRYSYYLRERKVRGQWTCVSAVRALAAQVTVLLARQQQPKIVQTNIEDKPTQGNKHDSLTSPDKTVKEGGGGSIEGTNTSLMQQLRLYSARQSVLATLDDDISGENIGNTFPTEGEMNTSNKVNNRTVEQQKTSTTTAATTTTATIPTPVTVTGRRETETGAEEVKLQDSLSVPIEENEKVDRFDVTATLPLDHTMDRPTSLPHPDEIRWLTHQFVRKGLGYFAVPPAELDSNFIKDFGGTTTISSNSSEHFQAVMRIRELLEDPLNGFTVEEGEDAVDMHLLRLMESDFNRGSKESPLEWGRVCESAATSFGLPVVKEKLQRSVERSLTPRERTHIIQQIFLERAASEAGMSDNFTFGTGEEVSSPVKRNSKKNPMNTVDGENEFTGTASRSIEEFLTKPVAIQRLYNFQSRFGTHLCRLLHCTVPDPLESLNGNFTASYSVQAENVYPPKRVTAVMLGGVPVPQQRQIHRVWCHYVSGIPSMDQFNELVASEAVIAANSNPLNGIDMRSIVQPITRTANTNSATTTTTIGNTSAGWGGTIGDLLRRQLLQHLRNSSQLLVPTGEDIEKTINTSNSNSGIGSGSGGIWSSEGKAQTILEGRHSLYPYDDSVVEIVTTDRSRMCRYVKSNEINCVLHYNIPSSSTSSVFSANLAAAPISFSGSFPSAPSTRKRFNEENIYFTTSFDDGVVLTCTQRVSPASTTTDTNAMTMNSEKDNTSSLSAKSLPSRRGKPSSKAGKSQTGTSTGFAEDNPVGGGRRVGGRRHKSRNRDGDALTAAAAAAASIRPDEPPRPFPVAQDGSILLSSTTANPNVNSDMASSLPGTTNVPPSSAGVSRGIPKLAVTIAANGFTIHSEEYEAVLWITHHDSSNMSTSELMRCMHSCETNATLGDTIEVEVRRAVLEEIGALCRYFQSGATQTLYPDGSVLTRYPVPSFDANSLQIFVETLTTASGECYVRQICEGDVGNFSHVEGNKIESRITFDRGNNCRILSRADRVTVVHYYQRSNESENGKIKSSNSSDMLGNPKNNNDNFDDIGIQEENINSEVPPFHVSPNTIARVTLHADGTCITSFSTSEEFYDYNNAPIPIRPLLEHVRVVETACGAPVRYCVEAPSLPRIFVCAAADENERNKETQEKPKSVEIGGGTNAVGGSDAVSDISLTLDPSSRTAVGTTTTTGKGNTTMGHPVILSPLSAMPTSVFTNAMREETIFPRRKTVYDRFYIVFGDGSVLRRRVTQHGTRGPPTIFLETLFTRPTESSVRIIHESGLAIVEPAEAARRNSHAPASLAIGEGFAMFDLALGGMRLVDYQHYVTEVRDLFSPGSIYAHIKPATLEELLRQLVLPTYTPHAVPKAKRKAMQEEELATETQSRQDRAAGVCPPLMNRLRELAESFIIAHELLRIDILNSAKRQWEINRTTRNKGKVTLNTAAAACWGGLSSLMGNSEGASLQRAFASLNMPSSDAVAATLPPMGITPLFFSELENGVVVQYLHERDVEEYMRSKDAEPFPIFLSHSTASGEPGVQQLTFFRAEAANGVISSPSMADFSRCCRYSFSPSSTLLHSNYGRTAGSKNTVVSGSLLGGAVQRQNKLAFFSGKPTPFPTTRWLPPAMQPPRRFLEPNLSTNDGNVGSGGGGGGLVVVGNTISDDGNNNGLSQSSYERLRVFLKFTEATRVAQQVVLLGEAMRYKQLASLVTYQRAMHDGSAGNVHEAEAEQQRLREKYFALST